MWDDIGGLRQQDEKREQIEWGGGVNFFQRARSKFISSNLAISNTKCRWTSDIKVSSVVGNDPGVAALLDCATLLYWCSSTLLLGMELLMSTGATSVGTFTWGNYCHTQSDTDSLTQSQTLPDSRVSKISTLLQITIQQKSLIRTTSMCYCPGWRARPPSELSIIAGDASVSPQEPNSSLVPATLITTNSHLLPPPSKTTLQTQRAHHLAQCVSPHSNAA